MKWKINKEKMVTTLESLEKIVEKATITPITGNVKMTLNENELTLVATDTRLQIKAVISLVADQKFEPFSTTVSAKKLLDSCTSCKDEDITFKLEENKLTVSFTSGRFSLCTLPAEDFPELKDPESSTHISLSQKVWRNLIGSTIYSVAERDHREALRGLLLGVGDSTICLVGTDGHRLAIAETEIVKDKVIEGTGLKKAILPRKSVIEMQRLFADNDTELTLSFSGKSHVSFQLEQNHIIFTSNLIEADYPEYANVLPKNNNKTLIVNRSELINNISNVTFIQREEPRTILMMIQEKEVSVCCRNFEGEEAEIKMVAKFNGDKIQMAFNAKYLKDALQSLESEQAHISIGESTSSVEIKESSKIIKRHYVIMPLNL